MPENEKSLDGEASKRLRRRGIVILVLVLWGIIGAVLILSSPPWASIKTQNLQVEWREEGNGHYVIQSQSERAFRFSGQGNRVFAPDTPRFHFGTNQDFSVEAWIKAYPLSSKPARQLATWLVAHPSIGKFTPRPITTWINTHCRDNDFGVTPIIDKHQTPSTIEAVGFQLYLDYGRLACQLAQAPIRPLAFQNFVSSGPNLQDGRWHHVALSVERNSATGGKLYVDSLQVLAFDPTRQSGDLSNSQPLRIGNHTNPTLRCFFKGVIGNVRLYRSALSAQEIKASFRAGR